MNPVHLHIDELNYELRIRGIVTNKDVHKKRKILKRALEREAFRKIDLTDPEFEYRTECDEINDILNSISTLIDDFEGPSTDSVFKRIISRLVHITDRVKRMPISDDKKDDAIHFKNEAHATCLELEAKLYENVIKEPILALPDPRVAGQNIPQSPIVASCSKGVPVYKWNLKFDDESKTSGLNAFLERVDELSQSRKIEKTNFLHLLWTCLVVKLWYGFDLLKVQ